MLNERGFDEQLVLLVLARRLDAGGQGGAASRPLAAVVSALAPLAVHAAEQKVVPKLPAVTRKAVVNIIR